ncbi:hypothetical protein JCM11641_002910 [Rhodosporidiobolus odoratus]
MIALRFFPTRDRTPSANGKKNYFYKGKAYTRTHALVAFLIDRHVKTKQGQYFTKEQVNTRVRYNRAHGHIPLPHPDSDSEPELDPTGNGARDPVAPLPDEQGYEVKHKLPPLVGPHNPYPPLARAEHNTHPNGLASNQPRQASPQQSGTW